MGRRGFHRVLYVFMFCGRTTLDPLRDVQDWYSCWQREAPKTSLVLSPGCLTAARQYHKSGACLHLLIEKWVSINPVTHALEPMCHKRWIIMEWAMFILWVAYRLHRKGSICSVNPRDIRAVFHHACFHIIRQQH